MPNDSNIVRFKATTAAIRGAVVHDDDFVIRFRVGSDGLDRTTNFETLIVSSNDHRDQRTRWTGCDCCAVSGIWLLMCAADEFHTVSPPTAFRFRSFDPEATCAWRCAAPFICSDSSDWDSEKSTGNGQGNTEHQGPAVGQQALEQMTLNREDLGLQTTHQQSSERSCHLPPSPSPGDFRMTN
jgi:hypothetical protein